MKVTWKANGEANSYAILQETEKGTNWLANVLINGEISPHTQGYMMNEMTEAIAAHFGLLVSETTPVITPTEYEGKTFYLFGEKLNTLRETILAIGKQAYRNGYRNHAVTLDPDNSRFILHTPDKQLHLPIEPSDNPNFKDTLVVNVSPTIMAYIPF